MELICSNNTIGASKPMPPEGQAILDHEDLTVLGVAIHVGHLPAVQWLVRKGHWDLEDELGREAMRKAWFSTPSDKQLEPRWVEIASFLAASGSSLFEELTQERKRNCEAGGSTYDG